MVAMSSAQTFAHVDPTVCGRVMTPRVASHTQKLLDPIDISVGVIQRPALTICFL